MLNIMSPCLWTIICDEQVHIFQKEHRDNSRINTCMANSCVVSSSIFKGNCHLLYSCLTGISPSVPSVHHISEDVNDTIKSMHEARGPRPGPPFLENTSDKRFQ